MVFLELTLMIKFFFSKYECFDVFQHSRCADMYSAWDTFDFGLKMQNTIVYLSWMQKTYYCIFQTECILHYSKRYNTVSWTVRISCSTSKDTMVYLLSLSVSCKIQYELTKDTHACLVVFVYSSELRRGDLPWFIRGNPS